MDPDRMAKREGLDAAIAYVNENGQAFGGLYIDQDGGLHINQVGRDVTTRAAVESLLPQGATVIWGSVRHTMDELRSIRDTLIGRASSFELGGSSVSSISVDPSDNLVVLTMESSTEPIESELLSEFGDRIRLAIGPRPQAVACSSRVACTPWRGGIYIYPADGGGVACTWGYNARSQSSSQRYMLTAGHCDNETWRHNGSTIGSTSLNNLYTTGVTLGDFQRASTNSSLHNTIYVDEYTKSRTIVGIRTYSNQVEGDSVCASGVTSLYRCGSIVDSDYWYCINFHGTKCMWGKLAGSSSDPMGSQDGDSGGPVFLNNKAYGIVSARIGSTKTVYGTIDLAMEALSLRLCLDTNCT